MAEIEADIENVRTAWNWAVARGQSERLDEASEGLRHFYEWRVRGEEGEKAFRAAAEKLGDIASGDGLRVLAKILAYQSTFSRPEPARQLLEQSLALLERSELADQDTRAERAFVLEGIGTRVAGSDRKEVRRLYERSLALCQSLGDRWGAAWRLWSLGCLVWESGALDEARQLVEEGLAIFRDLGSPRGIAQSLWLLAILARDQVQLEEAERLFHEGSAIYQELGERGSRPRVLSDMGVVSFTFGRYAEAHSRLEQSLAAYKDLGFRNESISPGQIIMLGYAKLSLGWYEQACTQGQTGLALSQDVGDRWSVGFSYCLLGAVALAREAYTDAHRLFEESVAVFREAGPREELGWALVGLGVAVRGSGNVQEAQQHLCETLRTAIETRKHSPLMYALSAVALLLADRGEVERAVEFYALASRYPFVANSRWFEDVFGRYIAAAAAALPPEVVAAAQERGRARDLWATVEEMLAELEGWQAVDD
jgi:tetratricopeptide (TPR) repeat protein